MMSQHDFSFPLVYWAGFYLSRFFSFFLFPFKLKGSENLPKGQGFILASNHVSNIDPIVLGIIAPRRMYFFAKKELFRNPVVAWILHRWNALPVDRGRADIWALKTSIGCLKKGFPLVFFPQGTRQRTGQEGKVFSGIGFLVNKTQVPVVPVFLEGSERVLPPGAKWFHRSLITVHIGKPIRFSNEASHEEIAQTVMEKISALSPSVSGVVSR